MGRLGFFVVDREYPTSSTILKMFLVVGGRAGPSIPISTNSLAGVMYAKYVGCLFRNLQSLAFHPLFIKLFLIGLQAGVGT